MSSRKVPGAAPDENRYYVHRQAPTRFLVRERQQVGEVGIDDPIIRSFHERETAHTYAGDMNKRQRDLDGRYGHWVQHAATPESAGAENESSAESSENAQE